MVDVILRARNFHFFYTDRGAVPVELAASLAPEGAVSVYFLSGEPTWAALLFLLTADVGFALLLGWSTRAATVLVFVLALSLDHRNVLVTSYADTLYRLLLFYAMFLPLGERWSIDAIHRDRSPRPAIASLASAMVLLQIMVMYLVTGYLKLRSPLWTSGDALPVILAHDSITFLLGDHLLVAPTLLRFGSILWVYLLAISFLLVVFTDRARDTLAWLLIGIHLVLAVTVRIGQFSYVAMAGLCLF